jgi:alpha-tubulin suppressor-like RCC1 family protein
MDLSIPTTPPLLEQVIDLRSEGDTFCAVRADGSAWCWGLNRWGEVGDGTRAPRRTPVHVRR